MGSAREAELHIVTRPGFTVCAMRGTSTDFAAHAESGYSVSTLLRGRFEITLAHANCELRPGATALLNVNEVQAGRAREFSVTTVTISPELMDELLSESGFAVTEAQAVFRSSVVRDSVLAGLARSLAEELVESRPGQLTMVDSLVHQLGVHLLRKHLVVKRAPNLELTRAGPIDRRLRLAVEFMHENYARDLDLEEIAGAAYLSSFYFQRLFKRLMGVSPHEYLAGIRMERARDLLLNTTDSVSGVSRSVGFRSQSHFARVFRDVNGVSPLAFRAGAIQPAGDS